MELMDLAVPIVNGIRQHLCSVVLYAAQSQIQVFSGLVLFLSAMFDTFWLHWTEVRQSLSILNSYRNEALTKQRFAKMIRDNCKILENLWMECEKYVLRSTMSDHHEATNAIIVENHGGNQRRIIMAAVVGERRRCCRDIKA